jgi:predicted GTPase
MRYNKGVMILVNKWDLYEKDSNTAQQYEELIQK